MNSAILHKTNLVENWVFLACVSVLCMACAGASPESAPVAGSPSTLSFEQVQTPLLFDLPEGKNLAIANPFGDIHVRQSDEASVRLNLHLQRTANSKVQARISQKLAGARMEFVVNADPERSRKDVLRIDLVVFVPQQPQLHLTTEHGTIEVKKINNPLIEAVTQSGELRLTTHGVMHARSKTGRIRATIMQPGWSGESRMESDSGPLQVFFPLSPNLHLLATSGVSISSEFELDIRQHGRGARAELNRGDGSDALNVTSHHGTVQLYSVVFNPADYPGK